MPADEMTKEEIDLKKLSKICPEMVCEYHGKDYYFNNFPTPSQCNAIARRFVEMAEKLEKAENQTLDAVLQKIADQRVRAAMDRFEKSKEA